MKIYYKFFLSIYIIILTALLILLLTISYKFINYGKQKTLNNSENIVEIPYASSLKKVVNILYENKIINNDNLYWYLRLARSDNKIQAGYYIIKPNISNQELVTFLLNGRAQVFKVTFIEGQTLRDLAQTLYNVGLIENADINLSLVSQKVLDTINPPIELIKMTQEHGIGGIEGYLLPETYFFSKEDSLESILLSMHKNLLQKLTFAIKEEMNRQNLSLHTLLTLASIVEKETAVGFERNLIANVYKTRLKKNMKLQADPTVIYGLKKYDNKITKKDLLTPNPYNTYTNKGLPLGPISSVSIESIKAVLEPNNNSNYLFFVSKNDGTHVFCPDLACHNKAVKEWQIDFFKKNK